MFWIITARDFLITIFFSNLQPFHYLSFNFSLQPNAIKINCLAYGQNGWWTPKERHVYHLFRMFCDLRQSLQR